jgi:hypothetical protein
MPTPGEVLGGRYVLVQPIGAGGMATVWRARDNRLRRHVAIKLLRPELAADEDLGLRFESEARHAAGLSHPNVATVYDADTDETSGERFIVMELIDGPTVADLITERGPLDPDVAVDIAAAAARALAAAHRRGVIHRDVKPANLLIGRDGRVRLADFGIARALTSSRVTMPGTVLGSIPYLSPEQARGDDATASGDVFSLGVVLFEMLTGRLPWEADTPAAMATMRLNAPAPLPSTVASRLPSGLDAIVARALAIDPEQRYPSARVFADALEAWNRRRRRGARQHLVQATGKIVAQAGKPSRRRAPAMGAALAGAGATAGGVADGATAGPRDRGAAAPASNPMLARSSAVAGTAPRNPWADHPLGRGMTRRGVRPGPPPGDLAGTEGEPRDRRRRRATDVLGLLALLLLVGVAGALILQPGDRDVATPAGGGGVISSSSALIPSTIAPLPTLASAFATPTPTTTLTPAPTAPATQRPTPRPTPTATPRAPASGPASAITRFYSLVVAHDWDAATDMWSPSMQQRYPPQEWLIDRFRKTTRIDITRLHTVFVDTAAGRARVEVTLVEYRTVEPSPRTFAGAWDLVRIDGDWVLDDPDF